MTKGDLGVILITIGLWGLMWCYSQLTWQQRNYLRVWRDDLAVAIGMLILRLIRWALNRFERIR